MSREISWSWPARSAVVFGPQAGPTATSMPSRKVRRSSLATIRLLELAHPVDRRCDDEGIPRLDGAAWIGHGRVGPFPLVHDDGDAELLLQRGDRRCVQ